MPVSTTVRIRGSEVELRRMKPDAVRIYRAICTEIGLADHCPFPACRRHRRCATAQVICYQTLREEINAIVHPMLRRRLAAADRPDEGDDKERRPESVVSNRGG